MSKKELLIELYNIFKDFKGADSRCIRKLQALGFRVVDGSHPKLYIGKGVITMSKTPRGQRAGLENYKLCVKYLEELG